MNKEYKLNIDPRILELLGPSLYSPMPHTNRSFYNN